MTKQLSTEISIAIHGRAQSGKNSLSKLLTQQLISKIPKLNDWNDHPRLLNIAFADPIKKIIQNMVPEINSYDLWGPSERRKTIIDSLDISIRQLCIDIGNFGRLYNKNIWIDSVFSQINEHFDSKNDPSGVILSDLRMQNELDRLKQEKFFIIKIIRPDNDYFSADISEHSLDNVPGSEFDHVLINDGTLEDLERKVAEIAIF